MDRVAVLTDILNQNPNDAFARYGLAMEYSNQGDVNRALDEFGKLLASHPDYTAGYFMAAQTLARANQGKPAPGREYEPIEVPKNTPTGFVNAFFAVVTGFALIWHIWWMAALGAFGGFVTFLVFAFREEEEIEIPAETIARFDRAHPAEVAL